jgi:glyoxylase-like metal-dependent hydrolase (beta-lactamase superfamily II)
MKIKCFTVGLFQTNMYILSNAYNEALIVDPACQTPAEQQVVLRYIEQEKLRVCALMATHGHLDHLWGAAWASEQFQMPLLIHSNDMPLAEAMQQQYDMFGMRAKALPFPMDNLQSSVCNLQSKICNFHLLSTPGHTQGSVCLYWPDEHLLLSGDTLFCCGYGRTDLPGGNMGQLMQSLDNLFALPADTRVFPGHGEATTIGAEKFI